MAVVRRVTKKLSQGGAAKVLNIKVLFQIPFAYMFKVVHKAYQNNKVSGVSPDGKTRDCPLQMAGRVGGCRTSFFHSWSLT